MPADVMTEVKPPQQEASPPKDAPRVEAPIKSEAEKLAHEEMDEVRDEVKDLINKLPEGSRIGLLAYTEDNKEDFLRSTASELLTNPQANVEQKAIGMDAFEGALQLKRGELVKKARKASDRDKIKLGEDIMNIDSQLEKVQQKRAEFSEKNPQIKDNQFTELARQLGVKDEYLDVPVPAIFETIKFRVASREGRKKLLEDLKKSKLFGDEEFGIFEKKIQDDHRKEALQKTGKVSAYGGLAALILAFIMMKTAMKENPQQRQG